MHHVSALLLLLATRMPINLLLHVRAVLDVLAEVADVAADFLVWLEREGDDGHEAEGEPFPALHYATREVSAVLALHGDVLCAGEGAVEDMCPAREEEEHDCGWLWCASLWKLRALCGGVCTRWFRDAARYRAGEFDAQRVPGDVIYRVGCQMGGDGDSDK